MISPELAVIEAMFKDGLRRVMAEDDPEDIATRQRLRLPGWVVVTRQP